MTCRQTTRAAVPPKHGDRERDVATRGSSGGIRRRRMVRTRMIAGLLMAASLMIGWVALAQTTCVTDADCSDGDACNGIEVCNLGTLTCEPGTPVVCTALDQCHVAGVCDPATGICSDPAATDGTACDDSDACTQTDTCQAGVCTAADPHALTALDHRHLAGSIQPAPGILSRPAA